MTNTSTIAVYWDFENIHLSVGSLLGRGPSYGPVDTLVNLEAIMGYIAGFGVVAINRAYGNWQWYGKYGSHLQQHSIQTVQMFPSGRNAKNGADIRMAIDIMDDLARFPNIATVVIVSGDVDFVPVAQRVRQAGIGVVGIGTIAASNKNWIASCTEFKQYGNLLPRRANDMNMDSPLVETSRNDNPASLLVRAINNTQRRRGTEWVGLGDIRPAMTQLDSTFDPAAYGETKFINFVRRFENLVEVRTYPDALPEINLKPGALEEAQEFDMASGFDAFGLPEILARDFRPFDFGYLDDVVPCIVGLAGGDTPQTDISAVKALLSECLPAGQIHGYYDLFRKTAVFQKKDTGEVWVPGNLNSPEVVRTQVIGALLSYLDAVTRETVSVEEFVTALGGDEQLLDEVARLPALDQLPVAVTLPVHTPAPAPPAAAGGLSTPARIIRQRGIFVPSPEQLEEVAQWISLGAQDQATFSGPTEITEHLSELPTVGTLDEADRLYKSVYTAHCFERVPSGYRVHGALLRPTSVKVQLLGRLLAYIEFIAEAEVAREDFARLFDDEALEAIIMDLPGESELPVPIHR